jgi:hypothetical protein
VPCTTVPLVESLSVPEQQPVHSVRQQPRPGLNDEVHVVAHEAVRVDPPSVAAGYESEQSEERTAIMVVDEDPPAFDPAGGDVEVAAAGERDPSGYAWHRATVAAPTGAIRRVDRSSRFRHRRLLREIPGTVPRT